MLTFVAKLPVDASVSDVKDWCLLVEEASQWCSFPPTDAQLGLVRALQIVAAKLAEIEAVSGS